MKHDEQNEDTLTANPKEPGPGASEAASEEGERLSCRSCGSPRTLDRPCESCGSAAPDDEDCRRLLRHRDLMRRALQRLQALAATVHVESNVWVGRLKQLLLTGSFMAVVGTFSLLSFGMPLSRLLVLALASASSLWLCWKGFLYLSAKSLAVAYADTDPLIASLGASHSVRCASCGGFSTMLQFDDVKTHPCPWCAAALVPSGDAVADQVSRIQKEGDRQAALARDLLERALEQSGRSDRKPPDGRPSFRSRNYRGEKTWRSTTGFEGRLVERVEVEMNTSLNRNLLFCRPETVGPFSEMAKAWRAKTPRAQIDFVETPNHKWAVYSDTDAPLENREELTLAVYDLHPADCLFLDRAGASVWSSDLNLTLSSERMDLAIDLIRKIRPEEPLSRAD